MATKKPKKVADLSEFAEIVLRFCEDSGLDQEQTGLVSAAVLCAVVEEIDIAISMVEFIDDRANQAGQSAGGVH